MKRNRIALSLSLISIQTMQHISQSELLVNKNSVSFQSLFECHLHVSRLANPSSHRSSEQIDRTLSNAYLDQRTHTDTRKERVSTVFLLRSNGRTRQRYSFVSFSSSCSMDERMTKLCFSSGDVDDERNERCANGEDKD